MHSYSHLYVQWAIKCMNNTTHKHKYMFKRRCVVSQVDAQFQKNCSMWILKQLIQLKPCLDHFTLPMCFM